MCTGSAVGRGCHSNWLEDSRQLLGLVNSINLEIGQVKLRMSCQLHTERGGEREKD